MALRAGRLNRRVALQSKALTADGGGGATEAWTTQASVWAHIEPLTGLEKFDGHQVEGVVDHRVTIRYRTDITTKWRVLYGSRVLGISAVMNPDTKNEGLLLLCREEDNEEAPT